MSRAWMMAAAMLALVRLAAADTVIRVGMHALWPDTPGQEITLRVRGGEAVTGFNLRAQIGDGLGPLAEPTFQAVSFEGGIWDARPTMIVGGPVDGAEQFAQASVVFDAAGLTAPAQGILVTLVVDTTGFPESGSFPLLLSGTEIGADSDFILQGAGALEPAILNGTIRIVPDSQRLPGDADLDGEVERDDLAALRLGFGWTKAGWCDGDFNYDRKVDFLDYIVLKRNYGRSLDGQVPEPTTTVFLALPGLVLLGRIRRPPSAGRSRPGSRRNAPVPTG